MYCHAKLGAHVVGVVPIPIKDLFASGSVGTLDNHAHISCDSIEAIVQAVVGYDPLSI